VQPPCGRGCTHLTIRLGIWLAVKLEGTIQERGAWTRQASDGPGDMGVCFFFLGEGLDRHADYDGGGLV